MRSLFLGKGVPVHIKEMRVSQSLKNVTGVSSYKDFRRASRAYTAEAHDQHREGYETLVHMVNKQWFGTLGNDVFNDFSGIIQSTLCFGKLAIRMVVFTI